jgi:hypothetical protein
MFNNGNLYGGRHFEILARSHDSHLSLGRSWTAKWGSKTQLYRIALLELAKKETLTFIWLSLCVFTYL